MTTQTPLLWLYLPLWGVNFDSEAVGLVGGQVSASIPYADEWDDIQQTEVVRERQRLFVEAQKQIGNYSLQYPLTTPPFCLTVVERRVHNDETTGEAAERIGRKMLFQGRTAVLVLRLYQPGWFLDPEQAEICFAVNDRGWDLERRPGPYRQAFLSGLDHMPFPGYDLKIEALTTTHNQPGAISLLWNQLSELRSSVDNASVEIALENFNRSYGFQLRPSQRLAHLFMALDAMLGGFDTNQFSKRVTTALLLAGQESRKAHNEAGWLKDKEKPGSGRWLRNRIAHGDDVDADGIASDAQLRMQAIVRVLLRQYIRFLLRWRDDQTNISQRFGLPDTCSSVDAFNKVLLTGASNIDAVREFLNESVLDLNLKTKA